jgi:hypothetical protein
VFHALAVLGTVFGHWRSVSPARSIPTPLFYVSLYVFLFLLYVFLVGYIALLLGVITGRRSRL